MVDEECKMNTIPIIIDSIKSLEYLINTSDDPEQPIYFSTKFIKQCTIYLHKQKKELIIRQFKEGNKIE